MILGLQNNTAYVSVHIHSIVNAVFKTNKFEFKTKGDTAGWSTHANILKLIISI